MQMPPYLQLLMLHWPLYSNSKTQMPSLLTTVMQLQLKPSLQQSPRLPVLESQKWNSSSSSSSSKTQASCPMVSAAQLPLVLGLQQSQQLLMASPAQSQSCSSPSSRRKTMGSTL